MTTKTWNFTVDGTPHLLTLTHGVWTREKTISLDGKVLDQSPRAGFATASVQPFKLGHHSLKVVIQPRFPAFVYDLLVDDISLATGKRGPQRVMRPVRQGALVLFALLIVIGIGINILAKSDYDQQLIIQEKWTVVTGKVTRVVASLQMKSGGENTPDVETYYPWLTVEYIFNDSRHTVEFEVRDRAFENESQALRAHEMGESQRLYVNPGKPAEAVKYFEKVAPDDWIITFVIIDSLFTGIGVFFVVVVWLITAGKPYALEVERSDKGAKGTSTRV
jgi:hypothetical protein